ncbi:hypothetical protein AVEN_138057-1 [Araneus ventricosus]|uniref:Uncharacterized protein n=1 Tax=Araneus ventricosus TaxID=182803 RepID=A0A4Y2V6E1_ARAVE|nr:hypothetical protein AVEN_138057-1 [Araneus ventricosus]
MLRAPVSGNHAPHAAPKPKHKYRHTMKSWGISLAQKEYTTETTGKKSQRLINDASQNKSQQAILKSLIAAESKENLLQSHLCAPHGPSSQKSQVIS